MLTYLAIAAQYQPKWLVWENVSGVLSSQRGRDFGTFLGALGQLGYGFAYRVLDAQYFGVAQRRKRVFVVGYLGNWKRAAAVLFERESLSGHPAPSREAGQKAAPTVTQGAPFSRTGNERVEAEAIVAQCLTTRTKSKTPAVATHSVAGTMLSRNTSGGFSNSIDHAAAGYMDMQASAVRRLTPTECERLQGFPDNYTQIPYRNKTAESCPDGPRYKAMGNSMAVPVMRWIGERINMVNSIGEKL
jgi:DNA (cytosine-5)-methyltransferase 1